MPEVPSPDWLGWAFWTRDPESVRNLFVILGGILVGVGGFGLLWWNIHRQTETLMRRHDAQVEADRERRITDNFTRAVEQLGSDKLETRLGAIYALERIARESRDDHGPIMETLTAFVRERALWPPIRRDGEEADGRLKPTTDVQACLTVIGRRRLEHDRKRLDLTYADLRGCILPDAHLEKALFWCAHLEHAILLRAHLEDAMLIETHLQYATLDGAHLQGANFYKVHLLSADLVDTDLTQEQFDNAYTDENTKVPPHIKRPPPSKPAGDDVAEAQHEVTATAERE